MKMNFLHRVAASIVALVCVFAAISCVQQEYEISEDNLNLEVTVFQEGTEIPLGSTGELNMEDLMESFGQSGSSEYLKATGENGEYFFEMSETLDLAECLTESGTIQNEVVKYLDLSSVREMFNFGSSDAALNDARLCVDFETNIADAAVVDLTIIPYYGTVPAESITRRLEIQPSESKDQMNHTKYWLGSNPDSASDEYVFVDFPVKDLLKEIPDMIEIRMTTVGADNAKNSCMTKAVPENYKPLLKADCTFQVPLNFDSTSQITFSYTITNLQQALTDIFAKGSLVFKGTVVNSFPLNIEVNAVLLDENGNAIAVNGANKTIEAGSVESPKSTDFELSFEKSDLTADTTISGLRLDFTATGVEGAAITSESTLTVTLQAYIPDGVTIDLNNLKAHRNENNQ